MPGMQCLTRQLEPGIIATYCEYVNSHHLYLRRDVNLLSDMKDYSAQHRGVGEMRQAEEAKRAALVTQLRTSERMVKPLSSVLALASACMYPVRSNLCFLFCALSTRSPNVD